MRNKAGAFHSGPDLDLHYLVKRRILKLLCASEKQDLYLRSHTWEHHKGMASKAAPLGHALPCTNNGYWDLGVFHLFLLTAQSCVAAKELLHRFVPAARSATGTSLADSGI